MKIEQWRAVVGFEGSYEVSDQGRVRSLPGTITYEKSTGRTRSVTKSWKGRVLRPGTVKSGHQLVVLGKGKCKFVHDLVLRAFVGPPPTGNESLHWDDNPANNDLGNLRWGTRSENLADFKRNYGRHQSSRSPEARYA